MKRTFISFLFFLCISLLSLKVTASSKVDTSKNDFRFHIPKYRMGFSPSAILHPMPTFQLSHDFRLNHFLELSIETGYVFGSIYGVQGFRIKPSLEFYLLRDNVAGIFIGCSFSSLNVWEVAEYSIILEDAYVREFRELRKRNLIGGYLTAGYKFNFSDKIFLECSSGLGIASIYNSPIPVPDFFWQETFLPESNGWNPLLGFYINFNLSTPLIR